MPHWPRMTDSHMFPFGAATDRTAQGPRERTCDTSAPSPGARTMQSTGLRLGSPLISNDTPSMDMPDGHPMAPGEGPHERRLVEDEAACAFGTGGEIQTTEAGEGITAIGAGALAGPCAEGRSNGGHTTVPADGTCVPFPRAHPTGIVQRLDRDIRWRRGRLSPNRRGWAPVPREVVGK